MNLPKVVIDTSAAFKWFAPGGEDSVPEALAIAQQAVVGELEIVAPAILHVEIANVVRYAGYPFSDAEQLVREFVEFRVGLYEADGPRLARALQLAYTHGLTVYDALFLQLAEELDCPLVTADRRAFAGIDTNVDIRLL
jgi:predicted nucleic acid-binding protein